MCNDQKQLDCWITKQLDSQKIYRIGMLCANLLLHFAELTPVSAHFF